MSEQDRPGPPDEDPVIGGDSPPPSPPPSDDPDQGVIGVTPPQPARRPLDPWEAQHLRRETPDLRTYGRDGPRAGYYGATQRSAGRTAAIYVSTIAALVIGGILIFLLFQVLGGDDEAPPITPTPEAVVAQARIESPVPGERVTVNQERAVIVSVVSGEDIVRFELLVSGIVTDQQFSGTVTAENTYAAVLQARFEAAGAYDLVVRAFTATGEEIVSDPIQVVAIPEPIATPEVLTICEIVGVASLRTGPGEVYNQAGTLEPGDVVTVTGKTLNLQWLQIERGGGLWVRFNAVETTCDLTDVPFVEPPPPPTATPTPPTSDSEEDPETPTPTPSEGTPTEVVSPNAPDFVPSDAVLIERGATLRITITNTSTNPFSGAIVVRVDGVDASPAEQVVNVAMDPNGTAAVNFTIDPPVTVQASVMVTVDPDEAIAESSEDNNTVEFVLAPPPEGPVLSLVPGITGGALSITIQNDGEALSTNDARLVVSVPGETTTRTISPLAVPEGQSVTIGGIAVPATGESIRVTLFIDGVNIATATVPNPNVVEVTLPEETPETGDDAGEPTEPEEPEEPEESQGQ